jgi:hypothetical protein
LSRALTREFKGDAALSSIKELRPLCPPSPADRRRIAAQKSVALVCQEIRSKRGATPFRQCTRRLRSVAPPQHELIFSTVAYLWENALQIETLDIHGSTAMPCRIKSTGMIGRVVRHLPNGFISVALAAGYIAEFLADDVEFAHTHEENRAPVNPCVGRSAQTSAITSITPAPRFSSWTAKTY